MLIRDGPELPNQTHPPSPLRAFGGKTTEGVVKEFQSVCSISWQLFPYEFTHSRSLFRLRGFRLRSPGPGQDDSRVPHTVQSAPKADPALIDYDVTFQAYEFVELEHPDLPVLIGPLTRIRPAPA